MTEKNAALLFGGNGPKRNKAKGNQAKQNNKNNKNKGKDGNKKFDSNLSLSGAATMHTGIRAMQRAQWTFSNGSGGLVDSEKRIGPMLDFLMSDYNDVIVNIDAMREVLITRPRGTPSYAELSADIKRLELEMDNVSDQLNVVLTELINERESFGANPLDTASKRSYDAYVNGVVDRLSQIQAVSLARVKARASRPLESGDLVSRVENTRTSELGLLEHEATTGDAVAKRYEELVRLASSMEAKLPLPSGYKENFEAAVANYRNAKAYALNILGAPGGNQVEYVRTRSNFQKDGAALRENMSRFADEFERQLKLAATFKGMCPDNPDVEKDVATFVTKEIPRLLETVLEAIDSAGNQLALAAATTRKTLAGADGSIFNSTDQVSSLRTALKKVRDDLEDARARLLTTGRGSQTYGDRAILDGNVRKFERQEAEIVRNIAVAEEKANKASMSLRAIPNAALYEQAITTIKYAALAYAKDIIARSEALKKRLICASSEEGIDDYQEYLEALMNRYTEAVYLRLLSSAIGRTLSDDAAVLASAGDAAVASQATLSHTYSLVNSQFANIRKGLFEAHTSVADAVKSPSSHLEMLKSKDTAVLYMFKLARIGTAAAAAFVATKTFQNHYVYAMSRSGGVWETFAGDGPPPAPGPGEAASARRPEPPDLRWFAVSFLTFEAIFNAMLFAAAWFVLKLALEDAAMPVLYDLLFDTAVGMALTAASVIWVCDIVQDKRYFEYRVAVPRAMRVVRQLTTAIAAAHAAVPYFFLVGPFNIMKRRRAMGGSGASDAPVVTPAIVNIQREAAAEMEGNPAAERPRYSQDRGRIQRFSNGLGFGADSVDLAAIKQNKNQDDRG